MARVMVKCAATDRVVPTGFRMNEAKLEAAAAKYAFRCPACGGVHQWIRDDAWLEVGPRNAA